jgi:hypothetical protein
MANNLPQHLYPTRDESGAIMAPQYVTQIEELYNVANQLLLKVDGDKTKPPSPNKQHNIPSLPADAISEGGSVDEYATHVYANSTKPRTSTHANGSTYSHERSKTFYRMSTHLYRAFGLLDTTEHTGS